MRCPGSGAASRIEALDRAGAAGIQHVDPAAARGDAHRGRSAGADRHAMAEPRAVDLEFGDGVAAAVHGHKDSITRVVDKTALRGELVDDGARERDAEAAGVVAARERELTVRPATVATIWLPVVSLVCTNTAGSAALAECVAWACAASGAAKAEMPEHDAGTHGHANSSLHCVSSCRRTDVSQHSPARVCSSVTFRASRVNPASSACVTFGGSRETAAAC